MNKFEEACILSCESWVNTFPDDIEYDFSPAFEKEMNILIDKMRNDKYHKFTRKTMTSLIIAAVVLSFATTAFAIPSSREYIIKQFENYFSYNVTDIDEIEKVENIFVGYLPNNFIRTDEDISETGIYYEYCNKDLWFTISKNPINTTVNYDNSKQEISKINNVEYIITYMDNTTGIIWNNGLYTYRIIGNIKKDTLLKIAENIE